MEEETNCTSIRQYAEVAIIVRILLYLAQDIFAFNIYIEINNNLETYISYIYKSNLLYALILKGFSIIKCNCLLAMKFEVVGHLERRTFGRVSIDRSVFRGDKRNVLESSYQYLRILCRTACRRPFLKEGPSDSSFHSATSPQKGPRVRDTLPRENMLHNRV